MHALHIRLQYSRSHCASIRAMKRSKRPGLGSAFRSLPARGAGLPLASAGAAFACGAPSWLGPGPGPGADSCTWSEERSVGDGRGPQSVR